MSKTIGGRELTTIERLILNADQYKGEIKSVTKLVRAQERHEKDVNLLRKKLDATTGKLSTTTQELSAKTERLTKSTKDLTTAKSQLTSQLTASFTKANLLTQGLSLASSGIDKLLASTSKYSKASQLFVGDLDLIRKITGGYIDDLDLMIARNQLNTLGVNMTSKEYGRFADNVRLLSDAMGKDMSVTLDAASLAMAKMSVQRADEVGVVMSLTTAYENYAQKTGKVASALSDAEKREAFQLEMLTQMTKKVSELAPRTDTLADKFGKLGNAMWGTVIRGSSSLNIELGKVWENYEYYGTIAYGLVTAQLDLADRAIAQRNKLLRSRESDDWLSSAAKMGESPAQKIPFAGGRERDVRERAVKRRAPSSRSSKATALPDIEDIIGAQTSTDAELAQQLSERTSTYSSEAFTGYIQEIQALEDRKRAIDANWDAQERLYAATQSHTAAVKANAQAMKSVGASALLDFGGGLWASADAAIASGESFGYMVAQQGKAALMGIAQVSTVEALKQTALALGAQGVTWGVPNPSSINHWAAAATWGAIGLGAGAGALGVSASSGGGGSGGDVASSAMDRAQPAYRPEFGQRQEDPTPINISVYLGNKGDLGAKRYIERQLEADIQRQRRN